MKNYMALANLFVINSMGRYQLALYIPPLFMERLTAYYAPLHL